jgi:Uma2 family endonuclease
MSSVANPTVSHSQAVPAVPDTPIFRLTVEQYHDMIRTGILTEDDPVELLEGWLVYKMSKNPPHRIATKLLNRAIEALVPKGWYVDSQEPITTGSSEPEPDVAVIRGDTRDYADRHPGAEHVALLAEVADSSLDRDCVIKARIYARAQISVYWIIYINERRVEVCTNPVDSLPQPGYRDIKRYAEFEQVPVVIDGQEVGRITVRDILP